MKNPTTNTVQNVVLSYKLTSFNPEERTGKLLIKKAKGQKTFNVSISALANHYFQNKFKETFEAEVTDVTFKSTLRSPEFRENPFRLVKFADGNYKLFLVNEAKPKKIIHTCPITNEPIIEYVNTYNKKKNFIRFIDASKSK